MPWLDTQTHEELALIPLSQAFLKLRGPQRCLRCGTGPLVHLELPCNVHLVFLVFFQFLHLLFANPFRKEVDCLKKVSLHCILSIFRFTKKSVECQHSVGFHLEVGKMVFSILWHSLSPGTVSSAHAQSFHTIKDCGVLLLNSFSP